MTRFHDISDLAGVHHGVVTLAQLRSLGRSSRQVETLTRSGQLTRVAPGVFVVAGLPASWRRRVLVACLAAGPDAMASHRTAAALWRLDECREGVIEVTVPRGRRRRVTGAIVHESDTLLTDRCSKVDGIPVTSAALTVLDMGRFASERRLGIIADDAVRRKLTTYEHLNRLEGAMPKVGRRRPTRVNRMLEVRPAGSRPTDSVLEDDALRRLDSAGIPLPESQVAVYVGTRRYDADLAWVDEMVILECDGWAHHGSPRARSRDNIRRDELQADGWAVLTITWISLRDEWPVVEATIRKMLARRQRERRPTG